MNSAGGDDILAKNGQQLRRQEVELVLLRLFAVRVRRVQLRKDRSLRHDHWLRQDDGCWVAHELSRNARWRAVVHGKRRLRSGRRLCSPRLPDNVLEIGIAITTRRGEACWLHDVVLRAGNDRGDRRSSASGTCWCADLRNGTKTHDSTGDCYRRDDTPNMLIH